VSTPRDGEADLVCHSIRTSASLFNELLDLADRLPRQDDAGHLLPTRRRLDLGLGETMTVGRHRPQHRRAGNVTMWK